MQVDWPRDDAAAASICGNIDPAAIQARRSLGRIGTTDRRNVEAHDRPRARRQARRHLLRAAQQGRAAPGRLEIHRRAPDVREAHRPQRLLRRDERDQGVQHLPRHLARRAARGDQHDHARAHQRRDPARRRHAARGRHTLRRASRSPRSIRTTAKTACSATRKSASSGPTVDKLRAAGVNCSGPISSDVDFPEGAEAASSTAW